MWDYLKSCLKGWLLFIAFLIVGGLVLGVVGALVCDTEVGNGPVATSPTSTPILKTRGPWPTSRGGGVVYTPTPVGTLTPTPTSIPTPTPTKPPTPTPTKPPTPTRPPTPTPFPSISAVDVYNEYQMNETRANSLYTGRWFTVTLPSITRIADDGKVRPAMGDFGMSMIELDFKSDRQTIPLNPGQSLTAVCKVSHGGADAMGVGYRLSFEDCRLP